MHEPTHASFFSGVGGLDLGLERSGWRTVSFSEIDPYASAVLAERWPGVPNLGDIVALAVPGERASGRPEDGRTLGAAADWEWPGAVLWTGGFPCQDLSVAGKRRGMVEGTRSNLAHSFLDLVERHRPPAVLLENVPGLLSSHRGRDMAVLLGRLAELGYGVAYRVLDARHFGVPQRRRRVFILGLRSEADDPTGRAAAERAAAVLAVGARCDRHPAMGGQAGADAPGGARTGLDIAGGLTTTVDDGAVVVRTLNDRSSPDARRNRETHGLAGRLDDRLDLEGAEGAPSDAPMIELAATLNSASGGGFRTEPGAHLAVARRVTRAHSADDADSWEVTEETGVLNGWDLRHGDGKELVIGESDMTDDHLLPFGLDSHRYRCCGNGVVANVAEWIGQRLRDALT